MADRWMIAKRAPLSWFLILDIYGRVWHLCMYVPHILYMAWRITDNSDTRYAMRIYMIPASGAPACAVCIIHYTHYTYCRPHIKHCSGQLLTLLPPPPPASASAPAASRALRRCKATLAACLAMHILSTPKWPSTSVFPSCALLVFTLFTCNPHQPPIFDMKISSPVAM